MTVARLTQGTIETLNQADPKARITQATVEAASQGTPAARLTQEAVEVLSRPHGSSTWPWKS